MQATMHTQSAHLTAGPCLTRSNAFGRQCRKFGLKRRSPITAAGRDPHAWESPALALPAQLAAAVIAVSVGLVACSLVLCPWQLVPAYQLTSIAPRFCVLQTVFAAPAAAENAFQSRLQQMESRLDFAGGRTLPNVQQVRIALTSQIALQTGMCPPSWVCACSSAWHCDLIAARQGSATVACGAGGCQAWAEAAWGLPGH